MQMQKSTQMQVFHHYEKWEDFQSGMYRLNVDTGKDLLVIKAIELLKTIEFNLAFKTIIPIIDSLPEITP